VAFEDATSALVRFVEASGAGVVTAWRRQDDVTNKLAARLATQGGSDNDWKLLAESYEYLGRKSEADAARAHIASAAPMAGSAGDLTGGSTGDQIADIANALDKSHARGGVNAAGPWMASGAGQPAAANGANGASGAAMAPAARALRNAEISGTVDIISKLAHQAGSGATLFIYAKQHNAPGPPLAVLRLRAEHWPVSFTLHDGNAMVPGHNLANADSVQIEARISKSGDALPHAGDLVGSVISVNPRDGHPVKISIDRETG
jgi:cytochrome c-type biogenesis protein CcmH